jgi:hypothetical protein
VNDNGFNGNEGFRRWLYCVCCEVSERMRVSFNYVRLRILPRCLMMVGCVSRLPWCSLGKARQNRTQGVDTVKEPFHSCISSQTLRLDLFGIHFLWSCRGMVAPCYENTRWLSAHWPCSSWHVKSSTTYHSFFVRHISCEGVKADCDFVIARSAM